MNEIERSGSCGPPPAKYSEMFRMVENGKLGPGAVITDKIGLEGTNDELGAMTDYERVEISATSGLG